MASSGYRWTTSRRRCTADLDSRYQLTGSSRTPLTGPSPRKVRSATDAAKDKFGKRRQQCRQSHRHLETGQLLTETLMNAVAEGQVRLRLPGHVEQIRIGHEVGVAVGRWQ